MFDSSGSRLFGIPTVEGVERCQAVAAEDGFWGIRVGAPAYGAFEDFCIGIKGVPGWIFLSRERYWR